MAKKVDEVNQRILAMLEERRLRRQTNLGGITLAQQILRKNGSKLPGLRKLPRI